MRLFYFESIGLINGGKNYFFPLCVSFICLKGQKCIYRILKVNFVSIMGTLECQVKVVLFGVGGWVDGWCCLYMCQL